MKKPLVELTIEEAIALCRQRLSLLKQKENVIVQQQQLIDELTHALNAARSELARIEDQRNQ